MKSYLFAAATLVCGARLATAAPAAPAATTGGAPSGFAALADRYIAERMAANPVDATPSGIHDYDDRLPDVSAAGMARDAAALAEWDRRLAAATVAGADGVDRDLLRMDIAARLFELNKRQSWRHMPDYYTSLALNSVFALVKRNFAPAETRLRAVIAREEKLAALLAQGRANLTEVPKVSLEIALEELPGNIDFLRKDTVEAFATVKDAGLQARFKQSTEAATRAISDYGDFLKQTVAPKTVDKFAIGDALFREKLRVDDGITDPLAEVLRRGETELKRLQREFKAAAAKIDPKRPATAVQADMSAEHGPPSTLLADVRARLGGLRKFLVDRNIASVPSEVMPIVEESPPFMRATTLASMDTPGSFETKATEAYYNVTLPDPKWSAAQAEDYMRGGFNRYIIDMVSIHEAFPGHYLQLLWHQRLKTKVRRYYSCNTNVEGWAHYTEQMLIDEGWGDHDPKLRLAQLQEALLRAARYVVGIRMHTRGMTIAQATEFFHKEGMQSQQVAAIEAKRGTEDPTYLYYTYGKLEILKLRDDYRKQLGAGYSLARFHDAFLQEGSLPPAIMRRVLLAK